MNMIVKRKTRAFTLIELLGVIVILGVLAAIATPIILGVIGNAQREAFRDTAYGVSKAANNAYVSNLYKGHEATNVVFTYTDGVETSMPDGYTLNYSGAKPQNGQVVLTKAGKVAIALHNGKYCATKGYSDSTVTIEEKLLGECIITEEIPAEEELTGTGTVDDPYVIVTEQQLYNVRDNMSAYYVLGRNITLSSYQTGTGFTPIGTSDTPFTGNINGNGHKIINLFINNPSDNVGLFGYTSGATIKNIVLESLNITGNSCTGSLVGRTTNNSVIDGVIASGDITGASNTGGLVGCLNASTITTSYAAINTVGSGNNIGGLIGYVETSDNVTINKTVASGNVTSTTDYVGGLIGQFGTGLGATVSLSDSYAIGQVQGRNYIGGLIGYSRYASITNTYAVGLITATSGAGGLVARSNNSTATNSYWSTDTTKVATSIIGTSSSVSSMLSKTTSYSDWDFINTWDIEEGVTLAYLRNMPIPAGIYKDELDYIDYGAGGGSGTQADPYIIVNETQLYGVRNNLSAYYKLGKDITLTSYQTGTGFDPIGTSATPFTGNFDGNGFTINNLYINSTANNVGLFGYVNGAKIRNVSLNNISVKGAASTGGLVGGMTATATVVENSVVKGTVTGTGAGTGLLVGTATYGTIQKNIVIGTVNGTSNVGGLVGGMDYSTVSLNYINGTVKATSTSSGAIVGAMTNSATVTKSVAIGSVTGVSNVGGIVGQMTGYSSAIPSVNNSYTFANVTASSNNVGGILGYGINYASVTANYTLSKVTASSFGGIIGGTSSCSCSTTNSYWSPETSGTTASPTDANATFISKLLSKTTSYNTWDFVNTWDIDEGATTAYLRGLPIPDNVYTDGMTYVDMTGSTGAGTSGNPFVIVNAGQVSAMRYIPGAYYKLGNDIDMSLYGTGAGFDPIVGFTGQLDGNGYKIKNLYINRPSTSNVGLFATMGLNSTSVYTEVKNITFENVNIKGAANTGAVAGSATSGYNQSNTNMKFTNVTVTGSIVGTSSTGGLVGNIQYATVSGDYVNATVSGTDKVGGLLGNVSFRTDISKSYTNATVTSTGSYASGLIGYASGQASPSLVTVSNVYATGIVNGTGYVGGLFGYAKYVSLSNSYTVCEIHGTSNYSATIGQYDLYTTLSGTNYWSAEASKVSAGNGTNVLIVGLSSKTSAYSGWDFTNTWDIVEGTTFAYLKGKPVPDSVKLSSYSYIAFNSGSGTQADPYVIVNESQLNNMRYGMDNYYKLGANITMTSYQTGSGFAPIGDGSTIFRGGLDGNGYKISNLYINRASSNIGLFGYTSGATIKNLTLENVSITNSVPSGNYSTGSVVGKATNGTSVRNSLIGGAVTISGSCASSVYTGGLIGYADLSTAVEKVASTVNVTSSCTYTGGLIGDAVGGSATKVTVLNSYSLGNVQGGSYTGGLIGATSYTDITNSYAVGTVSGSTNTGSLIGSNVGNSTATASYWSMEVSGIATSPLGTNNALYGMLNSSSYTGWDFVSVWDNNSNTTLPYLRGMGVPDKVNPSYYTYTTYTSGIGTSASPYIITTDTQLNGIRNSGYLGLYYKLGNDIDLSSYQSGNGFAPIGDATKQFRANFDGDGHKIINLYVSRTTQYNGLFGIVSNSTIKNLILENVNINCSTVNYSGALVGSMIAGTIDKVSATGVVKGATYVGGLVGQLGSAITSNLTKSWANVTVTATSTAGGLVGYMQGGSSAPVTVANSYATGSVTATNTAGGLAGSAYYGVINYSYATGAVTCSTNAGGLMGSNSGSSTATGSYWDTTTTGKSTSAIGTGKTTAQMYQQATYTTTNSWDFTNIWTINEGAGYPTLR